MTARESSVDAGSSEEEADDLLDHKEDQSGVWSLEMVQNIYCMSLVSPLTSLTRQATCTALTSVTILLGVNLLLQLLVLSKVDAMTAISKKYAESVIFFEDGGNCLLINSANHESLPLLELMGGAGMPHRFYNCGNLAVAATKNVSTLDLNADGMWDLEEAQELKKQWHKSLGREMNLDHVHKKLVQYAKQGQLVAQHGVPQDVSAIPASWMQAESGKLSICALTSKAMCGNMEIRGVLKSLFSETANDTDDRIEQCEDAMDDYCPRVFGVLWKSFRDYDAQGCGEIEKEWDPKYRVNVATYEMTGKYVSSDGAVASTAYFSFLLLIIVIWWLSIFTEVRRVLDWWIIVAFIDSTEDSPSVLATDDKLEVVSIPMWHKIYLIVLNIIPRTIIVLWLSVTGSFFLISADNYADLVLNSVALGFLIEIDEMMYTAVASHRNRKNLERCEEVTVRHRVFEFVDKATCQKYNTVSLFNTLLIGSIAICVVLWTYTGRHGKEDMADAIRCMCQSAGKQCLEAQVLGGATRGISGVSIGEAGKFHNLMAAIR